MRLTEYINNVIVYHGTSIVALDMIYKDRFIKKRNDFIYVTTKFDIAKKYSEAWTAKNVSEYNNLNDKQKNQFNKLFHPYKYYTGVVLELKINKSLMIKDDYNEDAEPFQYKIRDKISVQKIINIHYINFDKLLDKNNLLSSYAYWLGVINA